MLPINIVNRFKAHKLSKEQIVKAELHRSKALGFAEVINAQCPDNREKFIAITKLEEAVMWANKSLSKGGVEFDDEDHQGR